MAQFDHLPASERDYWIADWQVAQGTCGDCGRPVEECSDPKRLWYSYRRVCRVTMEREAALHAYLELHGEGSDAAWHDGTFTSWGPRRSEEFPYPALAGVSFGATDRNIAPWDKFTTERDASPFPPSVGAVDEGPAIGGSVDVLDEAVAPALLGGALSEEDQQRDHG